MLEITGLSLSRAGCYRYLSDIFRAVPDEKVIAETKIYLKQFKALENYINHESYSEGIALLKEFADSAAAFADRDELLTELNAAFTRLFFMGEYSVARTRSAYTSPSKLEKSEPWLETFKIYLHWNFRLSDTYRELEDALSMQLRFMSEMAKFVRDAHENGNEKELAEALTTSESFLSDQLLGWIDLFAGALAARDEPGARLYAGVAKIASRYMEFDLQVLEHIIQEQKINRENYKLTYEIKV